MSKDRRTVSLDRDVNEYLDRDGVNASELVNKLVKNHMTAGGDRGAMLELRKQQLESELQELDSRQEAKQRELEQVNSQLQAVEDEQDSVVSEAAEVLTELDLQRESEKVEFWASEAGLEVDEFVAAVREEWSA